MQINLPVLCRQNTFLISQTAQINVPISCRQNTHPDLTYSGDHLACHTCRAGKTLTLIALGVQINLPAARIVLARIDRKDISNPPGEGRREAVIQPRPTFSEVGMQSQMGNVQLLSCAKEGRQDGHGIRETREKGWNVYVSPLNVTG